MSEEVQLVEKKADNFLQKIHDDLLTCHICYEEMKDPRVLYCQHILCWNCIQACYDKFKLATFRGFAFPCPFCKQLIHLPKKGLAALPKCLYVNFVRDVVDGYETCYSCETASENEMYICTDCSKPVCSCCLLSHSERYHGKNLQAIEGETVIEKLQTMLGKQEEDVLRASSACQEIMKSAKEECTNLQEITKQFENLLAEETRSSQGMRNSLEEVVSEIKGTMSGLSATTKDLNKAMPEKPESVDLEALNKATTEIVEKQGNKVINKVDEVNASLYRIFEDVKNTFNEASGFYELRTKDRDCMESIQDSTTQILTLARSVDGFQHELSKVITETNNFTKNSCGTNINCLTTINSVHKLLVDKLFKDLDKVNKAIAQKDEHFKSVLDKLKGLCSDMQVLSKNVDQVKIDLGQIKGDVVQTKTSVLQTKCDVSKIKCDVNILKRKVDNNNYQFLIIFMLFVFINLMVVFIYK